MEHVLMSSEYCIHKLRRKCKTTELLKVLSSMVTFIVYVVTIAKDEQVSLNFHIHTVHINIISFFLFTK